MDTCSVCGKKLKIGDWPFCDGLKHESTRPERAQRFKPIVVFKKSDGSYSFPASDAAPTPEGYQRVEISTRRQAERLEREVNRHIREEKARLGPSPMDADSHGHDQLRKLIRGGTVTVPDHDAHGNLILRSIDGSKMRSEFKEYVSRVLEQQAQPQYRAEYDPGFHIDIMHNDSSNREVHQDASTGWQRRRE